MTNPSYPSERVNTGAEVNLFFNFWKLSSHSLDHSNLTPLRVSQVIGEAIFKNPSINLQ
jgi:hypothetical protein